MEFIVGLLSGAILWGMIVLVLYQLLWRGRAVAGRYNSGAAAAEIKDLRTRLRFLSAQYQREQNQVTLLQAEIAALQADLARSDDLARQRTAVAAENKQLRQELNDAKRQVDGLQVRLEVSCERLNESREVQEKWQAAVVALANLRAQLQTSEEHLATARSQQQRFLRLVKQLAPVSSRNQALRQELDAATAEVAALRQKLTGQSGSGGNREVMVADRLQSIRGIGPTYARRLHEAGIHTFKDLAALTAMQLKEITGASSWQADPAMWLADAQKFIQARADSTDS